MWWPLNGVSRAPDHPLMATINNGCFCRTRGGIYWSHAWGANGQFQPHYFIGDVFGALPLGCVGDCDAVEGVVTGEN